MSQQENDPQGSFLQKSAVFRGPQQTATQFYVPLPVFLAEAVFMVAGFLMLGFFVLALLPLHLIAMDKTNKDPLWVKDLTADIWNRVLASNRGQYGKNTVTFAPEPPRIRK